MGREITRAGEVEGGGGGGGGVIYSHLLVVSVDKEWSQEVYPGRPPDWGEEGSVENDQGVREEERREG